MGGKCGMFMVYWYIIDIGWYTIIYINILLSYVKVRPILKMLKERPIVFLPGYKNNFHLVYNTSLQWLAIPLNFDLIQRSDHWYQSQYSVLSQSNVWKTSSFSPGMGGLCNIVWILLLMIIWRLTFKKERHFIVIIDCQN